MSVLLLLSISVLLAGCGGEVNMQAPAAQDSGSQAADGAADSAVDSAMEGVAAEGSDESDYAVVPTSGEYIVRDKENLFEGVHEGEDDGVIDTESALLGHNTESEIWRGSRADEDDGVIETRSSIAESREGFSEYQAYAGDGVFDVGSTYLAHDLDENDWRGTHADQDDGTIQTESTYLGRQAVETLNEVEHHTRDRTAYTGYGQYNYD